jgi:hypothetical protein
VSRHSKMCTKFISTSASQTLLDYLMILPKNFNPPMSWTGIAASSVVIRESRSVDLRGRMQLCVLTIGACF